MNDKTKFKIQGAIHVESNLHTYTDTQRKICHKAMTYLMTNSLNFHQAIRRTTNNYGVWPVSTIT